MQVGRGEIEQVPINRKDAKVSFGKSYSFYCVFVFDVVYYAYIQKKEVYTMTYKDIAEIIITLNWHWKKIAGNLTPSQWDKCQKLKDNKESMYHLLLIRDKFGKYRIIYSNLLDGYPIYEFKYKPPKGLNERLKATDK